MHNLDAHKECYWGRCVKCQQRHKPSESCPQGRYQQSYFRPQGKTPFSFKNSVNFKGARRRNSRNETKFTANTNMFPRAQHRHRVFPDSGGARRPLSPESILGGAQHMGKILREVNANVNKTKQWYARAEKSDVECRNPCCKQSQHKHTSNYSMRETSRDVKELLDAVFSPNSFDLCLGDVSSEDDESEHAQIPLPASDSDPDIDHTILGDDFIEENKPSKAPAMYSLQDANGQKISFFRIFDRDFPNFLHMKVQFLQSKEHAIACVDSGATTSIVSMDLAKKLGNITGSNRRVKGLGADTREFKCSELYCTFAIEGKPMRPHIFLVIDGLDLPFPVVLGRDILGNNDLILDLPSMALHHRRIEGDQSDFSYTLTPSNEESESIFYTFEDVPVVLAQDVNISANTPTPISCKLDHNFSMGVKDKFLSFGSQYEFERRILCDFDHSFFGISDFSSYLKDSTEPQEVFVKSVNEVSLTANTIIGSAFVLYHVSEAASELAERDRQGVYSPTISELDPAKPFDPSEPFNLTPAHLRCGQILRLFEPRDMGPIDKSYNESLHDPENHRDPYTDAWTRERFRQTYPRDENLLTESEYAEFIEVLYHYRDAFCRSDHDKSIGQTAELRIPLKEGAVPHAQKPRRFALKTKK